MFMMLESAAAGSGHPVFAQVKLESAMSTKAPGVTRAQCDGSLGDAEVSDEPTSTSRIIGSDTWTGIIALSDDEAVMPPNATGDVPPSESFNVESQAAMVTPARPQLSGAGVWGP